MYTVYSLQYTRNMIKYYFYGNVDHKMKKSNLINMWEYYGFIYLLLGIIVKNLI